MEAIFTTASFNVSQNNKQKFVLSLTDKNKETNEKIFETIVSADWFLIKQFFIGEGLFLAEKIKEKEDETKIIFYNNLHSIQDTINISAEYLFNNIPNEFQGISVISSTNFKEL